MLASVILSACLRSSAEDVAAVQAVMIKTWDKPEARLDAGPVVVSGDIAVADWTQGSRGGRALLKRRDGVWAVMLCSGDGIRTEAGLRNAGVAARDARVLSGRLALAEKAVAPERLAAMSAFVGTVQMHE